jgi:23S rRNA (uracil1939-C5)-methyltransferase
VYRISANSFFQTNTLQAERLYDVVLRLADLHGEENVFDLYSGTGTIALHLAGEAKEVVGVESVPAAVEDARRNARENGVSNCTFVTGDLKDRLWHSDRPKPDVVVVDPPRAGMHPQAVADLSTLAPTRIVYVSCNPATQARDLKLLCARGEYMLTEIQPVDMFPQTMHVENVVGMRRITPEPR